MKKLNLFLFVFLTFALNHSYGDSYFRQVPSSINLGVGEIDVFKDKNRAVICSVDYRAGIRIDTKIFSPHFSITPIFGGFVTSKLSAYTFAGIELSPIRFEHFYTSILFTPGLYYQGNGKDLGYPLEFRSGVEVGSSFHDNKRIALQLTHLSNASISKVNPGIETLMLIGNFGF